jgi:hypothetical protein
MNVDISWDKLAIERVWFDASCGRLFVQAGDFVNSIEFARIPDEDFESQAPVNSFAVGQSGNVVLCRHKDGAETWLPADMWLPEGCTPQKT